MSTEVEQQQQAAAPVPAPLPTAAVVEEQAPLAVTTENGESAATPAPATTNGDTTKANGEKKNGSAAPKKEPEPPKDPKTETAEWIKQQHKKVIHKANFVVIDSLANYAYPSEEEKEKKPTVPATGFVSKREFVDYLKDGVLLARLASKVKPGSVESVKEGEDAKSAENQKANVEAFTSVAKEHLGEDEVFTYDDLQKGKESYVKVFVTIFKFLLATPERYNQTVVDFDQLLKDLSEFVPKSFLQEIKEKLTNIGQLINTTIRRPFTRSSSTLGTESTAAEQQNGTPATNGTNGSVNGITAAPEANGSHEETTTTVKVEEKKEEVSAPAVAAN